MTTAQQRPSPSGLPAPTCTAFAGPKLVMSGPVEAVAVAVKHLLDEGDDSAVLIFDDETSRPIEIDFRGTADDVLKRVSAACSEERGLPVDPVVDGGGSRGPGRPRLGVVAREVTLLPRHWEWLGTQPGGASAALRRLVDDARRAHAGKDRVRQAQEAAYRFMMAMAGNEQGFEEATRALFAGDAARFAANLETWPPDVRAHAMRVAAGALGEPPAPAGETAARRT